MKKIILLGLMASCLFVSCSDDDNSGPAVYPTLTKITQTHYSIVPVWPEEITTDTIAGQKSITEFENGKPVMMSIYLPNGSYTAYYQFSYNNDGFLSGQLFHSNVNGQEINTVFTYDSQQRLQQIAETNTSGTSNTATFSYTGNTITKTLITMPNGYSTSTIYELNANQTINKETHYDGLTVEYTYNGLSMVTANATMANGGTNNRTFTYDETHDTSLLGLQSLGGDFWFNTVYLNDFIYHTHETAIFPLEKYLTQQNRGGYDITDLIYEFNEIGQPTTRLIDFNGSGYIIDEFTYE